MIPRDRIWHYFNELIKKLFITNRRKGGRIVHKKIDFSWQNVLEFYAIFKINRRLYGVTESEGKSKMQKSSLELEVCYIIGTWMRTCNRPNLCRKQRITWHNIIVLFIVIYVDEKKYKIVINKTRWTFIYVPRFRVTCETRDFLRSFSLKNFKIGCIVWICT